MFRFVYLLRRSNNFRLLMLWILVIIHWIINHTILVTNASKFSHLSETRQRYANFYENGFAKTDHELAGAWTQFKMNWLSSSEEIWFWLLLAAIVYTPIALREEFSRAWTVAWARSHSFVDLPDDPPTPPLTGSTTGTRVSMRTNPILNQMYIFAREFTTAIIAEILGERMMTK
mgnify:FL=1